MNNIDKILEESFSKIVESEQLQMGEVKQTPPEYDSLTTKEKLDLLPF